MASSGSFTTSSRSATTYPRNATFSWTQTAQSVENNYTDISWSFKLGGGSSSGSYIAIYSGSITVNGTAHSFNYNGEFKSNGFVLKSGTTRIYHNADGTKSFSASGGVNIYGSSEYYSGSGNFTLNTIPRASTPSLANSTFNIGDTITVNTNRASSNFTHTIQMTYGSTTTTIGTGVGASLSYNTANIASGLYAVIPNATSLTGTITCTTYSGSTNVGSKTCSFTAKAVAANAKPTFSNFTYADTNSTTTAVTGNSAVMISGKSTLSATISAANAAAARYSATMKKYTFALGGTSSEQTYTTSAITKSMGSPTVAATELPSGTRDLVITAIDSRGYSTAVTKSVTIVPYAAPIINASASRANGFGNTTTISISGKFSRIEVSGTAKNTVNASTGVKYRYKPQSSTSWTIDWTAKSATVNTTNGTITVANFTHDLDNQTAYDFQFQLTDKLQTTTASIVVPVGQPAFWIGADGRTCVGGMPSNSKRSGENGHLEVKGTVYTTQQIQGSKGGAWYLGRDNAVARNTNTYTNSTYAPVVSAKSNSGDWSMGCLKNDATNKLYFSFCSDTNYNSANNTTSYRYIDTAGRSNIYPLFPVGAIFMTTTQTTVADVQAVLAGTWERFGQGKVLVGVDPNDTDFNAANKTGGAKTVTLTTEQIPSHRHSASAAGSRGKAQSDTSGSSGYAWNADSGSYTGYAGGGKAHQNMPPYITVYMYRRTA